MNEDFDGQRVGLMNPLDFSDGTLPGQNDELASELLGKFDAGRAGDGHLSARMNREVRRELADQAANPDVLHDGGVDTCRDNGTEVILGGGQFVFENEGIESDVAADSTPVDKLHEGGKVRLCEILGAHARVESGESEVDGVGPVFHRCTDAFPIAGGRQELGARGSHTDRVDDSVLSRARLGWDDAHLQGG